MNAAGPGDQPQSAGMTPEQWRLLFDPGPGTVAERNARFVAAGIPSANAQEQNDGDAMNQSENNQNRRRVISLDREGTRTGRATRTGPSFSDAITAIRDSRDSIPAYRPATYRPGAVPVLGGQAAAIRDELTDARASRPDIPWDNSELWFMSTYMQGQPLVRIADMTPEHIYHEIDIVVGGVIRIFQIHAGDDWLHVDHEPIGLTAKRWLALQPMFRALVQEAMRKSVALSDQAYLFIRQFVLTAGMRTEFVAKPQPWADTARLAQQTDIQSFVNHPVRIVTEQSVIEQFGRSARALRLDDD